MTSVLIIDGQWRMIGEALLLVDRRSFGLGSDTSSGDVIIDTPTDVIGPGLAAIAPPGIGFAGCGWMNHAIDVDQTEFIKQTREPGSLFGQEAGVLLIALPVLQINFLVGNIPVAANDNFAAARLEHLQVGQKHLHEAKFGLLALFAGGS